MGTTPFVVIGEPTAARAIALRSKRRAPIIFPFAFLTGEQKRVFDAELLTIPECALGLQSVLSLFFS